jgi:hypothetical protein
MRCRTRSTAQDGPGGDGRLGVETEGDDVDEAPQRRIVVVGRRVDAPGVGERAQPEVPLSLAGTHEEVTAGEVFVDDRDLVRDGAFVFVVVTVSAFEVLQMGGDVHVDDEGSRSRRHLGMATHHARGCEHDVGPRHQRPHVVRGRGDRTDPHGVVVARGFDGAGQGDVEVTGQHAGQMPRPDGRSRHRVGDGIEAQDEDAGSHRQRRVCAGARRRRHGCDTTVRSSLGSHHDEHPDARADRAFTEAMIARNTEAPVWSVHR